MLNKENIIVLLLACINFTHILDFMIVMPLGPQLMRLFHISTEQFGLLVSAYTLSAGVSGFFAAFFVDKYDRKSILLLGYIGFVVGTFACAFADSFVFLLLARTFAGAFGGLIAAQLMSMVGDLVPFERRGSAMGKVSAAFSVASVIGVPLSLYMAAKLSWHAPFILVAFLGAILIPLIILYVPQMKSHIQKSVSKNPFLVISNIRADTNQQKGLLLGILLMIGHFSIIPFLSPYMVANVGFSESDLSYIYLVGGALTFFTSPIVGKLADKRGKLLILTILTLVSVIPVFLITNMPRLPIGYALVVTALFFVFASGRFIPANAIITSVVPAAQRGSYMSIVTSMQQLAAGIASYLAGLIITKSATGELLNYQYVGYVAILISLSAIFVAQTCQTCETDNESLKVAEA